MSVEGHQAEGRRGHAGVHERALARLLRDDEDSAARGPRLHARATRSEDATVAIVNRRFAEHFFPGKSAVGKHIGSGAGPEDEARHRDHRRRRRLALRRAARRRAAAGVHPELGQRTARRSTCARTTASASAYSLMRNEVQQLDAAMPVYAMKTRRGAARRDAADRSADRAAVGRLRPARDAARVGRPLRRDGVRRRAAQEGAGHPPRARRAARRRHLAGDARGAAAARRSAWRSASRRRWRSAATCRRSSTASSRTIRAIAVATVRAADARVGGGRADSRAPRQPHRSDPGAAARIARSAVGGRESGVTVDSHSR